MTAPSRRPVILACQTLLATAAVASVSLSAVNVVHLDIVEPGTTDGAGSPGGGGSVAMVSSAPVDPEVEEVDLEGAEHQLPTPLYTVLTRPIPADGYATVGVTWDVSATYEDEEDIGVEVRTSDDDGWSAWQEMHVDVAHGPSPGDVEPETVRAGTDAVVVGNVDRVQVRVQTATGRAPGGLELSVIDPGAEEDMELQPAAHGGAAATAADATQAAQLSASTPAKPTIFSRGQWGANESLRDGSPSYGTVQGGFVHHTVNANDYTREQVPSIIRGIYAYHTQSRGWSDVGYNFLVDRFGRIWEGRYGGVGRAVVGAHTLGYNEHSFAMSAIGNFDTAGPPQVMLDAYARLFAWKLSLHNVTADSRVRIDGDSFQAISGHRDAGSTACPGRYLYAKLPEIRTAAARIQRNGGTSPPAPAPEPGRNAVTNLSGSDWPDVPVRRADGSLTVTRTEGQLKFERSVLARSDWAGKDLVVAPGDLTGDRHGDVIARDPQSGKASLFPGDGDGGFRAAAADYARFNGLDQLVGAADFDGDGDVDLVGRVARSGALRLFPGLGGGAFDTARTLAAEWPYDLTVGPGDLDGDGRPDLLARRDGRMHLMKGRGSSLAAPVQLPGSWDRFDIVTGRGDVTRDGRPDVLARDRSTKLTYVYPSDGDGGFGPRHGPFVAFRGMRWFAVGGHLKQGRGVDAVGIRASSGALKVFGHTGRRNVGRTVDTGIDLPAVDSLVPVGDWNRDGHGDLMYRERSSGRLMFLAGRSRDRFAAPVVAASGFGAVTGLVAGGDLTGDGRMDLLGEDGEGVVRVYPGNGGTGVGSGFSARNGTAAREGRHQGVVHRRANGEVWLWRLSSTGGPLSGTRIADDGDSYDWFLAAGDVDGVGGPDVLARDRVNGRLFMLPVTADGLGPRRYVADELTWDGVAG